MSTRSRLVTGKKQMHTGRDGIASAIQGQNIHSDVDQQFSTCRDTFEGQVTHSQGTPRTFGKYQYLPYIL